MQPHLQSIQTPTFPCLLQFASGPFTTKDDKEIVNDADKYSAVRGRGIQKPGKGFVDWGLIHSRVLFMPVIFT